MKNKDINAWIIIQGKPIYTCRTRRQARKYVKTLSKRKDGEPYRYIGKCIKGYRQIILDV